MTPTPARLVTARLQLREAIRLLSSSRGLLLESARDDTLNEDDRAELGTGADYAWLALRDLQTLRRLGPVLERLTEGQ